MRTSAITGWLLAALLVSPPSPAQEEATRFEQAWLRLDAYVEQHRRRENVPGLALAVTSRTGLLTLRTYGWADVTARVPVRPDTLFEIGSISKSFTAIALLQLAEEGRFDPQAPVNRYLPWFRIQSRFAPLTGHHLLSHSAGLPRDRDDIPASLYQAVALAERSTGFAPGERFYYSNIGYQVLGYLLEELEGQTYASIIRRRILVPLEMTASEPVITHDIRQRVAVGYQRLYDDRPDHPSHPLIPATWIEYGAGDGSLAATPADLAAYLRMLLNRGVGPRGRILSEESFSRLTQPVVESPPHPGCQKSYYGYGLGGGECEGHHLVMHGGGMLGYQAMLLGDPEAGLGVVVFINGPGNSAAVASYALKLVRAATANQALPPLPQEEEPTDVQAAADYAGTYTAPDGRTLRLVAEGPRLLLEHAGKRLLLERRGGDTFFVPHPDFALFLLRFGRAEGTGEKAGPVVEAWHGSDWFTRDTYTGPQQFAYPKSWEAYRGHYRAAHAWFSNFRVLLRKGKLWLVAPGGAERELVPLSEAEFRVGEPWSPERVRFDTIVRGQALRATLSGCAYYRSFTP